jgi:hypothetical protein
VGFLKLTSNSGHTLEQNAFRQTYPNAHMHVFESGGHLREITHQDEYPELVRKFLAQPIN